MLPEFRLGRRFLKLIERDDASIATESYILVPSLEMLFCETWERDKKVSHWRAIILNAEESPTYVGMWEGRSEEQTVSRSNSSSSYSYFLMCFDQFWAYDILILLNNTVCDVTEVYLLHILSDYVSFQFQFEWK
jgi:hypothetical protein